MKKIELKFDNTLTRIAGDELGREIYKEQVEPSIKDILKMKNT